MWEHAQPYVTACSGCGRALRIRLNFYENPPWSNQFHLAYEGFDEPSS